MPKKKRPTTSAFVDPSDDNSERRTRELIKKIRAGVANVQGTASALLPMVNGGTAVMAKNIFKLQKQYAQLGIDTHVDIGFHYTKSEFIGEIQKHGLLTVKERTARGLQIPRNGATFGEGIYTGNNPFAFRHYGNVGERK